jgi:hypothetical protein
MMASRWIQTRDCKPEHNAPGDLHAKEDLAK